MQITQTTALGQSYESPFQVYGAIKTKFGAVKAIHAVWLACLGIGLYSKSIPWLLVALVMVGTAVLIQKTLDRSFERRSGLAFVDFYKKIRKADELQTEELIAAARAENDYRRRIERKNAAKRTLTRQLWTGAFVVFVALFAFADLRPLYEASKVQIGGQSFGEAVQSQYKMSVAALNHTEALNRCLHGDAIDRACLLAYLPTAKTYNDVLPGVFGAQHYLKDHPEDTQMQAAALQAIGAAREDLLQNKSFFDALAKVEEAKERSILFSGWNRMRGGWSAPTPFWQMAQLLNRTEIEVRAPQAAQATNASERSFMDKVMAQETSAAKQ